MEAKEKSLTFLREQFVYIVPYFQRGYVWNEESIHERTSLLTEEAKQIWPGKKANSGV